MVLLASAGAAAELEPLATLAVQDGGRLKPLDTFARETARLLSGARPFTGGERISGLEPSEWILAVLAEPERWKQQRIVRVTHAELRDAVGLSRARDHYSFAELVAHEPLLERAEAVHRRLGEDPDAALTPVEREIASLYDRLGAFASILSGEGVRIVPNPAGGDAAWLSVAELGAAKTTPLSDLRDRLGRLVGAHVDRDAARMAEAAAGLRTRAAEIAGAAYPGAGLLATEVQYNRLKPFRLSWLLYLAGWLLLLASFPLKARVAAWLGMGLLAGGLALQTYGMALRVVISGRAPVTNMYETVVFVAWGAVALALVLEALYRTRYVAACAGAAAVVSLILADNLPILDASIQPLVPVLRDNMWLTLHVLTISLGYAAFLLAMALGHLNLALFSFAPGRGALLKRLSLFLYRALQVGTLFLALGTLLGGVWASYSWGRFWGWDPKETWALIALLGYLAILHGRFLGWFRDFGMAVGSIVGFLGVLMAWYGVNFVLGTGLHSYGFGSGGSGYAAGFVALELFVVAAAALRRSRLVATAGTPAGARLQTNP
jgi:cytochrome c-type biogenesis protein CcsB